MPESVFQTYLNRLNDLSAKNRLLYLPRLEGFGMVDVREFDFLTGFPAFDILRQLIQGKKEINLIPEIDPRVGESNQLSKKLGRLAVRDQLTQEETGEQSLYLTWLFAEGKLPNGQVLRAPLLLKPISLDRKKGNWILQSKDHWQWNPAFLLAWRHAVKTSSESSVTDGMLEDLPSDTTEFRTKLSSLIQENFPIQVQSNIFEDQILSYPNSQISLDQERMEDGKMALRPYAVMGQFAQKSSFLFSDYEELIHSHGEESLEDLFQSFFSVKSEQAIIREENLFPVFPLDASQENVLKQVRQGKSLVVEGPPGTGKSQLIANLVSDYIARGKKVLVVSQKRAALDVVYERMAQQGFGDFLALVHDFQGDQKLLFQKIKKQIDSIDNYQEQNRGIDSIHLEREISLLSRSIARLEEKFEEFRKALFDDQAAGIPIKAMYLKANLNGSSVKSSDFLQLNFVQASQFEHDYAVYATYQRTYAAGFWADRISFSKLNPSDFTQVSQALNGLEEFRKQVGNKIPGREFLSFLEEYFRKQDLVSKVTKFIQLWQAHSDQKAAFSILFSKQEKIKLQSFRKFLVQATEQERGFRFDFQGDHQSILEEVKTALPLVKSFWGKIQFTWKKSSFGHLVDLLQRHQLKFEEEKLLEIQGELQSRISLQEELDSLEKPLQIQLSGNSEKDLNTLNSVWDLLEAWNQIPEVYSFQDWKTMGSTRFGESLEELRGLLDILEKEQLSWKAHLSTNQILKVFKLSLEEAFPENPLIWNSVFSELVDFDRFLEEWKFMGLGQKLWEEFEGLEAQIQAFWNGWFLAWIEEIERRNPVLGEAGSFKFSREMEELKHSILEKRKISGQMALLRLREQVSDGLEFNRLGNRLTYRELHHQVSKKRQRWPVRKLVQELGDEIFRLLPCWLGSPETVSAVFPIYDYFDLVIFDEASQCPVERGLPAMLRGKQVVVAGDSKQLRPSDFYQIKWESEEEGLEYEAESLLELAGFYFETHHLKGHYRSADPALIHFSNSHFYEGKLETLPEYSLSQSGETPFYWEKVEGVWENQINRMEAEAVLERVKRIQKDYPEDSIGVVTGNYFQMELIRERLWKAGVQESLLKVRNIENVQGDEFDQVILSLGYAPNREGKLVTNFGLLGKSGSENRLNVAISRARKKYHVISSIEPEDFRAGQLQNPGLSLLREFLTFVREQSLRRDIPVPGVLVAEFEINWSLKNKLLEQNQSFSRQIPSAVMDLVFSDKQGQLAVLTDDQRFFNASSAKAAMAFHPILLEEKGWKWFWKWSRERLIRN
ncbi:AAA domain-containing protein [Algoriphagus mannitolivorans]|uniref:AAA domain-containing protein n=1 Tax=Algoriphagus mannitolivorans TaxID=226504 RepID=UPI000400F853|nr:AAA domain-containing protein [Algoriphagus mannitolivorans]